MEHAVCIEEHTTFHFVTDISAPLPRMTAFDIIQWFHTTKTNDLRLPFEMVFLPFGQNRCFSETLLFWVRSRKKTFSRSPN